MTLLTRLTAALFGATVALQASAAPIEFTVRDFEPARAGEAAPLTVWLEESNVYLKRLGDIDLDAPLPPAQSVPQTISVPEPISYSMLLAGMLLLLLVGARRSSRSQWSSMKVGRQAD